MALLALVVIRFQSPDYSKIPVFFEDCVFGRAEMRGPHGHGHLVFVDHFLRISLLAETVERHQDAVVLDATSEQELFDSRLVHDCRFGL